MYTGAYSDDIDVFNTEGGLSPIYISQVLIVKQMITS